MRYYQSVGMFKFSSYSISINFFQKQNELFPIQSGISLASCSKNILKSFLIRSPSYFISPITNHPSTLMLSQDISELSKNPELNPGLLVYDNILYPHNYSLTKIGSCKSLFRKLKHNFFTTTLKISLIIYRILIKLMLFTIKKLY